MKSASQISAEIRAKKKKMEEDHSDAVKLSGIPEDATDILIIKNKEEGERLSHNMPKDRNEEPALDAEVSSEEKSEPHEAMAPDPMEMGEDDKMKKHAKIKSMMSKMGR